MAIEQVRDHQLEGRYLYIDGTRSMTGDLNMGGNAITNVTTLGGYGGSLKFTTDVWVSTGKHVRFYNATDTEYTSIYRDDSYLWIDLGTDADLYLTGNQIIKNDNAPHLVITTYTSNRVMSGALYLMETWPDTGWATTNANGFRVRYDGADNKLLIESCYGTNEYDHVGFNRGDHNGGVIEVYQDTWIKSNKALYFNNAANNEYGLIRRDDSYLLIQADTSGSAYLRLDGEGVYIQYNSDDRITVTSSEINLIDYVRVRGGNALAIFNSANTENGKLLRDDNSLTIYSGTGGNLYLNVDGNYVLHAYSTYLSTSYYMHEYGGGAIVHKGAQGSYYSTSLSPDPTYPLIYSYARRGMLYQAYVVAAQENLLYKADRNPDWTITYSGGTGQGNELNAKMASNLYINVSTDLPFTVTYEFNGIIEYTDVLYLAIFGHRLSSSAGTFTDYEIWTKDTNDVWNKQFEYTGVSHSFGQGLYIPLFRYPGSGSYFEQIKGVRIVINGGTKASWLADSMAISRIMLMECRPNATPAAGFGALDLEGGEMKGNISMLDGTEIRFYPPDDNSKYGYIKNDADYLYLRNLHDGIVIDAETYTYFYIDSQNVAHLGNGLFNLRSGYYLQLQNSGNTESATISRDDTYLSIDAGTGGGISLTGDMIEHDVSTDYTWKINSAQKMSMDDNRIDLTDNSSIRIRSSDGVGQEIGVAHLRQSGATVTGTVVIELPDDFSTSTMMHIIVRGYNYSQSREEGPWECHIGGYMYSATKTWLSYRWYGHGTLPFNSVRLGKVTATGKAVLLLGTTTGTWSYPQIEVDVIHHNLSDSGYDDKWSISIVTDESPYSSIVDVPPVGWILSSDDLSVNLHGGKQATFWSNNDRTGPYGYIKYLTGLYFYTSADYITLNPKDYTMLYVDGVEEYRFSTDFYVWGNKILLYNAGDTEYGEMYRNDDYYYIKSGTGGDLILDGTGGVVYLQSGGVSYLQLSGTNLSLKSGHDFNIYNSGNTEYGQIKRSDTYLYLKGGTGGDVYIGANATSAAIFGSTYIYHYKNLTLRDGRYLYVNNPGNTESAYIFRTDDALYIDSGTGGYINFRIAGNIEMTLNTSGDLQLFNGNKIYLYNALNTELGSIQRDDNTLLIDSGAGGYLSFRIAGTTEATIDTSGNLNILNSNIIYLKNSDNSEYGMIWRDDNFLYVYGGTGGSVALGQTSEEVIINADGLNVREGLQGRWYNNANTEYGYIQRDDNYLYIDAGVGGDLSLTGVNVLLKAGSTPVPVTYIELNSTEQQVNIFKDLDMNGRQILNAVIPGYTNDHGSLSGLGDDDHTQYHTDARALTWHNGLSGEHVTNGDLHDHSGGDGAQIDHGNLAGLGDDDHTQYLLVDGTRSVTGAFTFNNTVNINGGNTLNFYNSGNTEHGHIYRDDDYLYINSGTGGELALRQAGVTVLYTTSGYIDIQNVGLRIRDAKVTRWYNGSDTEYGFISRDDANLYVNSGTGGNLQLNTDGTGYLMHQWSEVIKWDDNDLSPYTDNSIYLGLSTLRWKEVHAFDYHQHKWHYLWDNTPITTPDGVGYTTVETYTFPQDDMVTTCVATITGIDVNGDAYSAELKFAVKIVSGVVSQVTTYVNGVDNVTPAFAGWDRNYEASDEGTFQNAGSITPMVKMVIVQGTIGTAGFQIQARAITSGMNMAYSCNLKLQEVNIPT